MVPTEFRLAVLKNGYDPIPDRGKDPGLMKGWAWQKIGHATPEQATNWSRDFPDAINTGVLCRDTPFLDLDILNQEAADAAEALVAERFNGHYILKRFGQAPKRAIPFQTAKPFKKIKIVLIPPNVEILPPEHREQGIEFLCDGQQCVVDGIHPDTKKPYSWHGGTLLDTRRDALPRIDGEAAQKLVEDIVDLLVRKHGYRKGDKPKGRSGNGGVGDWSGFLDNLIDHDRLAAGAMRLLRSGMSDGAAVNFLRAAVTSLKDVDEERRKRRLTEIPEMVSSARAKLDKPDKPPPVPSTLDRVVATFNKWLELKDPTPLYAVLGAIAANLLPGDPVWLVLIAPPSSAKTEILLSLSGSLRYVVAASTLTPASLLSGTPSHQRNKAARGGLLNQIGEFGILCLKDLGSILSMRPEAKAEILAALRELFDGSWTRHLGTDGGRTLSWSGKLGLVAGATQSYDDHYSMIGSLGDRFLLSRIAAAYGGQLRKALGHTGRANKTMREELAGAVAGLFVNELQEPVPLSAGEIERLDNVVKLAVKLRAHVTRDRYSRDIENIHGAEGPGRLGLSLERLFAGLNAIRLPREQALRIVESIALDSTPPIRRHAFELLTETPTSTRTIAKALKLPTITARRALEELTAHGLAVRSRGTTDEGEEKQGGADLWCLDPEWTWWPAAWAATADLALRKEEWPTSNII